MSAFFQATIQEVDCYDFQQGSWRTLKEKPSVGVAAGGIAAIEQSVLYVGGESGQKTAHNDTQRLDLKSETWEDITPLQHGRHGTQTVIYEKSVYIASGSGNRGGGPELTSIEKFSY